MGLRNLKQLRNAMVRRFAPKTIVASLEGHVDFQRV